MKSLVTGGGGFLGRYIVKKLVERKDKVRVFGRNKYPELERPGVETIQADLRDKSAVEDACRSIDVVFHAGSHVGIWGKWKDYFRSNVEGTKNVISGCIKHKVSKMVYTSSASVIFDGTDLENVNETYPYPQKYFCHYQVTKAQAEKLVIEANGKGALLTTSLRPHLIWGPDDPHLMPRLIQKAKDGKLLKIGEGKNRIDTIYVENAAAAHLLAADHLYPGSPVAGQCYFISDGKPVVLWDFISQVLKKLEIPPIKRSVSYNTAKIIGLFLEIFHRILNLKKEPVMTRLLAAQLATSHFFDISRARRDFGYNPIINIEEGLERLLSGIMERTG